jgi:hypothetical protein
MSLRGSLQPRADGREQARHLPRADRRIRGGYPPCPAAGRPARRLPWRRLTVESTGCPGRLAGSAERRPTRHSTTPGLHPAPFAVGAGSDRRFDGRYASSSSTTARPVRQRGCDATLRQPNVRLPVTLAAGSRSLTSIEAAPYWRSTGRSARTGRRRSRPSSWAAPTTPSIHLGGLPARLGNHEANGPPLADERRASSAVSG